MIKVILWDIDATLLNFKQAERHAMDKCFSLFGLGECTDELLARYAVINQSYWKRLEKGEVTREQVHFGRFHDFFEAEGMKPAGTVEEFNHQFQIGLGEGVFFNDNGYDLVKRLQGKYKQYVVTNGSLVAQELKLKKSGLGPLMDGVFISEQIGAEKPSKAFFDAVWENIGTYEKDEVVIIGDSLTSDIQGGNNAGIKCIWYNPEGKENTTGYKVDYEIQDLNQVEAYLNYQAGNFESFRQIVAKLRSEDGCPWDREQTFESLKPCMINELTEVMGAIHIYEKEKDAANLCEELGDLLLQVVLLAQIAEEEGLFQIEDVIRGISKKMVRRHPHVFPNPKMEEAIRKLQEENGMPESGKETAKNKRESSEIPGLWELIKQAEKQELPYKNKEKEQAAYKVAAEEILAHLKRKIGEE